VNVGVVIIECRRGLGGRNGHRHVLRNVHKGTRRLDGMFNIEQNTAPHIVVNVPVFDAVEAQAPEDQRQGLNTPNILSIFEMGGCMVGIALGASLKGKAKLAFELELADVEQLSPERAVYGR